MLSFPNTPTFILKEGSEIIIKDNPESVYLVVGRVSIVPCLGKGVRFAGLIVGEKKSMVLILK